MATQPLIALASRSPRRRELLHQIGVHHTVLAVDVDFPQPWFGDLGVVKKKIL